MLMPASRYDLIIFDCDGVLIDSEIMSSETLISLLDPLGVSISHDFVQRHFLGRSFAKVAETVLHDFGVVLPQEFESTYRTSLLEAFETGLVPTDGIVSVLEALTTPFCVATSSSPERARRSLEIVGLAKYFDQCVFTASQVRNGKPAPDLFLFAAEKFRTEPKKCLVIEDSFPGIKAAEAAGMDVWRYVGGSHLSSESSLSEHGRTGLQIFDSWTHFLPLIRAITDERLAGL